MRQVFKTLYQQGDRPRDIWVICPFAGSSLSAFKSWMSLDKKTLPDEFLVMLATYPGRDHRMQERPLTSITELASDISDALMEWIDQKQLPIDAQILLCGHSMGAQVAFEVCQKFENYYGAQSPIKKLILSACHAPHIESRRKLSLLNNDDFINQLIDIGCGNPILQQNSELLSMFLPMLRSDFYATDNYSNQASPEKRLRHTPCVLVFGERDPEASESEVAAWYDWLAPQQDETPLISIAGDHFYISSTPEIFLKMVAENEYKIAGV